MNNTTNDNDFTVANAGEFSGLTIYRTTELANDLLREMISYYAREIMKEENNPSPDFERITDLQNKKK
jgi:hypothetical protein